MKYVIVGKPQAKSPEQRIPVGSTRKGLIMVARLLEMRGWFKAELRDKDGKRLHTDDE